MTKNFLKRLSIALSALLFIGNSYPVLAYELDNNKNSIESVEYQNAKDEDFKNLSVVHAELASIYKVTIPKALVLSGVEKDADYFVKVEGDIEGYEAISAIPDENFILSSKNKNGEIAIINQDKTQWRYNDFAINANGNISAPDITAGKWQGTFNFYLSLDKVLGDIISIPNEEFSINLQYGDYNTLNLEENKTYVSSNPDVFIIDDKGNIIAKGEGTAYIVITDKDNNIRQIPVTIKPSDNINFNIETLENNEVKIEEGDSKTINLKSANALNLVNPRFESADKEIATIDKDGNIIGLKKGITTITIYSDNSIPKTITVIIDKPGEVSMSPNNNKVETLKMSGNSKTLNFDTDKQLTFESEDEEILTVDENGTIIAKNVGTTFIKVEDENKNIKRIKVDINPSDNIVPLVENKEINNIDLVATENKKINIVSNDTLILKNVSFISSNPNILKVDNEGNIEAVGEGTTTITIKSDNSIDKVITVTVGHKEGKVVKENEVSPTCTEIGTYDNVTYCTFCGKELTRINKTTPALGHNYVEGTCTRCGNILPELIVNTTDFTGTYDGKAHSITVISEGNTVQYSTDNINWTNTNPAFTNAGTYTVFYKVTKPTYKTVTGSQVVTINKANSTVATAPTAKSLTYNGSAQTLVNTGTATNGVIQYSLDNKTFSTTAPTATNAGSYTVYYKVVGDTNHNDVAEKNLSTTIAKKANVLKLSATSGKITDSATLSFNVSTNESNGTLSIANSNNAVATASLSEKTITITAVKEGVSTITVKSAETTNYKAASTTYEVTVGHKYVNGKCTRCGDMKAGLYDNSDNLVKTWDELVKLGLNVEKDYTTSNYKTAGSGSVYDVLTNNNLSGKLIMPNSVTNIGKNAFYKSANLTSVTIPGSVTSIGNYAFCGCPDLTSVTIPGSVTSIGVYVFGGCTGLTSVTMSNSVTSINKRAFMNCSKLTSITIPGSVTSIGDEAFANCTNLTSVTIPGSVTSIGVYVFGGCTGLTSVTIQNGVTSIGNSAFNKCTSLTSVTIPNSVTSIGERVFYGCDYLTSVTIPNSVTSIDFYAFGDCRSLTSVTIPNSVTSIGTYVFNGCTSLKSVTLGKSVTSIGNYTFGSCSNLASITYRGVTYTDKNAFNNKLKSDGVISSNVWY